MITLLSGLWTNIVGCSRCVIQLYNQLRRARCRSLAFLQPTHLIPRRRGNNIHLIGSDFIASWGGVEEKCAFGRLGKRTCKPRACIHGQKQYMLIYLASKGLGWATGKRILSYQEIFVTKEILSYLGQNIKKRFLLIIELYNFLKTKCKFYFCKMCVEIIKFQTPYRPEIFILIETPCIIQLKYHFIFKCFMWSYIFKLFPKLNTY